MSIEDESPPEWGRLVISPQVPSSEREQEKTQEPLVQLSAAFIEQMRRDVKDVEEIVSGIQELNPSQAIKRLHQATGYSKRVIRRALRNEDENAELPETVRKTVEWFKSKRRRHWILGDNERRFATDLVGFSEGKPTDFLMWNCLEFSWEQEPSNGYPPCSVSSDLGTSMVIYHERRLEDIASQLSLLGRPNITVLVPSSEATYEDMWTYRQSRDERESVLNETVNSLNERLSDAPIARSATIRAQRWDDYLSQRGIEKKALQYSREGEARLWQSTNAQRIEVEATENGVEYFARFGIEVDPGKVAPKRVRYYGMYEGEGAAITDIRKTGTSVIVLNFEEFRVTRLALRGAGGRLPIVTPVTDEMINAYYRWESEQNKRKP